MKKLISNIIFLLLLLGGWYYAKMTVNPYNFRDYIPRYVMAVTVGQRVYHVPLRYMEPRYPGGVYSPAYEAVIWLNVDPATYKILPQQSPKINDVDKILVALTSEANPQANRVSKQFALLRQQAQTFKTGPHHLRSRRAGETTDYINGTTHIACKAGKCLLFHAAAADQRQIISFNESHLADWQIMLDQLNRTLPRMQQAPGFFRQIKNMLPEAVPGIAPPATSSATNQIH